MTAAPSLLLRTPRQHADESPCGYVLRLAEANGYTSPRSLFHLAGIPRDQMFTLRLDSEKLSAVLGPNGQFVQGYQSPSEADAFRVLLCGHQMTPNELDLWVPKVCPACIRERGYLPAWHDLSFVDGCPKHKCMLVTGCPDCGGTLDWFRPGLLTCRCGASLDAAPAAPIAQSHADILGYIVARFEGWEFRNASAMPEAHLRGLSLKGLMSLAKNLAAFEGGAARSAPKQSLAAAAGRMLSEWPRNLMTALSERELPDSGQQVVARVRWVSDASYKSMLRNVTSVTDVALIREAVASFATTMSYGDLADWDRAAGTKPGAFSAKRKVRADPARALKRVTKSNGVSARLAASTLGIPVSVLGYLRASGHFKTRHKSTRVTNFHEADITAFQSEGQALAAQATVCQEAHASAVPLRRVFKRKFKYADGKGELVAAILKKEIPVLGMDGEDFGGLLVDSATVDEFIGRAREQVFSGALTPTEAAKILGCDATVVPGLAARGHLAGQLYPAGWRVTRESVESFGRAYRPVALLARERGSSSRALMKRLAGTAVTVLEVQRPHHAAPQPFIRVEDIGVLDAGSGFDCDRPCVSGANQTM